MLLFIGCTSSIDWGLRIGLVVHVLLGGCWGALGGWETTWRRFPGESRGFSYVIWFEGGKVWNPKWTHIWVNIFLLQVSEFGGGISGNIFGIQNGKDLVVSNMFFRFRLAVETRRHIFLWVFTPKIGEDEPILTSIFFQRVGSTAN